MPKKGGPHLLLCGCPFFSQIFTIPFLDTEIKLFLGKISKNPEGIFFSQKLLSKFRFFGEYLYTMKESISVKQDYVMIMHNPVEDSYNYIVYHVLDISKVDGKTYVNVQNKTPEGTIKRFTLTEVKFYDLLSSGFLTRLQK